MYIHKDNSLTINVHMVVHTQPASAIKSTEQLEA